MDHEEMMLECLKLATDQGYKDSDALRVAQGMFNQIKGRTETTDIVGGGRARVVGKDTNLGKFTDYVKD